MFRPDKRERWGLRAPSVPLCNMAVKHINEEQYVKN